ncbi:hypothetical protein ES703_73456 [subsurface metagenome]
MEPHECRYIYISMLQRDDEGNWLTIEEASAQPADFYTVEIEWKANGRVCPLTGWQCQTYFFDDGSIYRSESPMVNMTQVP